MAESMYRYTAIGEPIGAGEDDYYYNMSSSFRTTEPPMTEDEALLYGQKYFTYAETVSAATAAILIYLIRKCSITQYHTSGSSRSCIFLTQSSRILYQPLQPIYTSNMLNVA